MTIQLEEGRRYKTRDGQESGPVERRITNDTYFMWRAEVDGVKRVFKGDGRWGGAPNPLDLVSLIKEPDTESEPELQLEVGETYVDELGEIWTVFGDRFLATKGVAGAYYAGDADGRVRCFEADGSCNLQNRPLIKKHTPPVEVKPVWVFIFADGDRALSYSREELLNCVTESELASGQVHRIPLTWEPGRRDDLEADNE